jgi:hypothetical protein
LASGGKNKIERKIIAFPYVPFKEVTSCELYEQNQITMRKVDIRH